MLLVIPALSTHPLWSWAASLAASFLEPNVAVSPNQSLGMGLKWLLSWNWLSGPVNSSNGTLSMRQPGFWLELTNQMLLTTNQLTFTTRLFRVVLWIGEIKSQGDGLTSQHERIQWCTSNGAERCSSTVQFCLTSIVLNCLKCRSALVTGKILEDQSAILTEV